MADTKISALTDGETAETGDRLPAARDSSNVYVTVAYIVAAAGAAMNSANLSGLNNAVTARTNLLIVTLDTTTYEALDPPNADTLYFITDAE